MRVWKLRYDLAIDDVARAARRRAAAEHSQWCKREATERRALGALAKTSEAELREVQQRSIREDAALALAISEERFADAIVPTIVPSGLPVVGRDWQRLAVPCFAVSFFCSLYGLLSSMHWTGHTNSTPNSSLKALWRRAGVCVPRAW